MKTPAEKAAEKFEAELATRYGDWLAALRRAFPQAVIADYVRRHESYRLSQAILQEIAKPTTPKTSFDRLVKPCIDALKLAGHLQAEAGLPVSEAVVQKATMTFSFDEVNPYSVQAAQLFRNGLIREITQQVADAIQIIVANGVRGGAAPETIAKDIHGSIGLTARQATAVQARRAALEEKGNSPAAVDKKMAQYYGQALGNRAITIARTETLRAANLGQELGIRQAQMEGAFGNLEVRRFWIDTNDSRTRPDHREVPKLNRNGVGLDEPFRYPGGRFIARPGDPNAASADMVINCRCTVAHRLFRRR